MQSPASRVVQCRWSRIDELIDSASANEQKRDVVRFLSACVDERKGYNFFAESHGLFHRMEMSEFRTARLACYDESSAMVLSDVDIKRYIEEGKIRISPSLPPEQFGSCSVDFRLGAEFNVFEHSRFPYIDLRSKTALEGIMRSVKVEPGEAFILQPREFVLAITEENLELDADVLGRLEGRSSLGRIGIIVHGTAGLFDPGWSGKATLELSNLGRMPVALYPGMRICSFTFEQLSSPSSVPYRSKPNNKYAGQTQPLASRLDREGTGGYS